MDEPYPITSLSQFRALTSPVRGEIIDIVDLMGAMSIAEIASHMGRPVDSLYYHVRRLVKVGLLVETGKRKSARQQEAIYDLPGRPASLHYSPSQTGHVRAVVKSIGVMLRMTERDFKAAFAGKLVRGSGGERNVVHSRVLGWYTEEEIQEIRHQIRRITTKFRSSARTRKRASGLYALTTVLMPLGVKKRGDHG